MRRTIILAAALSIILLGIWGTAVIFFDEDRLRAFVSDRLGEQLGRRVEIVGKLTFTLFPNAQIEAGGVIIHAPGDGPGPATLRADRVKMSLRLAPLLRGELSPGTMQLTGAIVRLASREDDGELSDPLAVIRSSAKMLTGRSVLLQDVILTRPSARGGVGNSVSIGFVELERFRLDEPVAFRFRGDLGEPVLLESVEIEGYLMVPSSPDSAVRLRDMRLVGRLPGQETEISLSGDVTTRSDDPLRLTLSGGRLGIGSRDFDLSLDYQAGEPPAVDLLLSGAELNAALALSTVSERLKLDTAGLLSYAAQVMDLRSQMQFDRLRFGAFVLANARVDLRSRGDGLALSLSAAFPGGMVDANGVLGSADPGSVAIDVSLAEFSQLLDALELPVMAGGSGEAKLVLRWPAESGSGFLLTGEADLWHGFWQIATDGGEAERREFDRFSTDMRWTPGFLELPAFAIQGTDLAGAGWAAVELDGGRLGGEFLAAGPPASRFDVSGTASRPELAPSVSAGDEVEPDEQDERPEHQQ